MAGVGDMAAARAASEQVNTLRESNAHLRTQNRELDAAAARAARDAEAARASVAPLNERIT